MKMNESRSGNGGPRRLADLSTRSVSEGHAVRAPYEIALNLDDIIYYVEQVLDGAIELDPGFLDRARDFTDNCLIDAEAWLKEWVATQDEPTKEIAEARLVQLTNIRDGLRQKDLRLEEVKDLAKAALSLLQWIPVTNG